jgi:hypothetical protein
VSSSHFPGHLVSLQRSRQITIDPNTGGVTDTQVAHEPTVKKNGGVEIDVGFFIREIPVDNERIDGVILSNEWPGSLKLDHTRAINNPMSDVDFELEKLTSTSKFRAKKNFRTA